MKRLLGLLSFLWATCAFAATGDITATINPDGWSANLSVAGFTRGASYAFGFGTDNTPSASTPYFTVVSLGFDDTGSATTVTRTVYLTDVVRFPYGTVYLNGGTFIGAFVDGETITEAVTGATGVVVGAQSSGTRLYINLVTGTFSGSNVCTGGTSGATFAAVGGTNAVALPSNDELVGSSAMTVRVALSDYIYQKDNTGGGNSGTAPTFTAPAAFITNSGGASETSTVSSAAAVTQSSTCAYQRAIGNWSEPGWNLLGATFPLSVVAFHSSGQSGRPVRVVRFDSTDGTNTVTQYVTTPTIDATKLDATPVIEYTATMACASATPGALTQGAQITHRFRAYPWVGDSGSVLDSGDGANASTSGLWAPAYGICDKNSTYGITVAVCDPAGDDSTGAVVDRANYGSDALAAAAAAATPFLTVGKAFRQIAIYNVANHGGRDNIDGGVVYLKAGTYEAGSSNNIGQTTTPKAWATVQPYPGVSRSSVVISNLGSGYDKNYGATSLARWYNLKYTGSSNIIWQSATYLWIDSCELDFTAGHLVEDVHTYYTRNLFTNSTDGGMQARSGTAQTLLQRGNTVSVAGSDTFPVPYTCVGNLWTAVPGEFNSTTNNKNGIILSFNRVFKYAGGSASLVNCFGTESDVTGAAFVQNLLEFDSGNGAMLLASDGSSGDNVNNVLIWHNTIVGGKANLSYNDLGTVSLTRKFWSLKNNIFEDYNIKSDTLTVQNGARVGNWPALYKVGCSGDLDIESVSAAGLFLPEFDGLLAYSPARNAGTQPPTSATNSVGFAGFTDRQAGGTGGGTYTLQSTSPAVRFAHEWILPFDIEGSARGAINSCGAYADPPSSGGIPIWFLIN